MSDAGPYRSIRLLKPACALVACGTAAYFAWRSLGENLWLDELLTLTLVQADSLPRLWAGIASGIDGNPPLYLTLGWLLIHAMPALSPVTALRIANVVMTAAAIVILYRVSLRIASRAAAWMGTFLFLALNSNVIVVALELRTYALYLLLASLAVLLQQRLIERRRGGDAALLALAYAALALAHTFGIVYVACIALAGWLSQAGDGRRQTRLMVLATVPAIIALACWLPFFIQQSAVGRPYIWIAPPTMAELLLIVFASPFAMRIAIFELCCLGGAIVWFSFAHGIAGIGPAVRDPRWQAGRYFVLLLAAITGFTLAAWIASLLLFPLFVARYFTPQLIVSMALHIGFCELAVRLVRGLPRPRTAMLAVCAIVIPPAMFAAQLTDAPPRREPPCADSAGAFFESDFVRGDLPVIAESPHVFMPRAAYARHATAYRFPLDWDVVINYPDRARGNATDFHIMENLKTWANRSSIMSTDEIVRSYPQFLVIEQSGRAWFHNLQATRDVTAEKLTESSSPGGDTCTLWKVTSVKAHL
jgi:hypothetical protein